MHKPANSRLRYHRSNCNGRSPQQHAVWPLVAVILIAALCYFAGTGWTGRMLAQHLLQPARGVWNQLWQTTPPPATPTPAPSATAEAAGQQVQLPGFTLYALQAGDFDRAEDAETLAQSLKTQGGAGYVRHTQGRYAVLISAYPSLEDAQTVAAQVAAQQPCQVVTLVLPPLTLQLIGSLQQAQAMEATLGLWREICLQLGTVAIEQSAQPQAVQQAAQTWAQELQQAAQGLAEADADGLKAYAAQWVNQLQALEQQADPTQAARLLQLQMTDALITWAGGLQTD